MLAFPAVVWHQGLAIPWTQPRAISLVGTSTRGLEFGVLRPPNCVRPPAHCTSLPTLLLPCVPSSVPSLGATAKGHKSRDFCPHRVHQVSLCIVNHVADCAEFFVEPRTESSAQSATWFTMQIVLSSLWNPGQRAVSARKVWLARCAAIQKAV